jgi:hypothetical protein
VGGKVAVKAGVRVAVGGAMVAEGSVAVAVDGGAWVAVGGAMVAGTTVAATVGGKAGSADVGAAAGAGWLGRHAANRKGTTRIRITSCTSSLL